MKPARILLLVVAVVAGGLAAFLATRGDSGPAELAIADPIREPSFQVLVASQSIGVGQRLNRELVEWQTWPESALRSEYVTQVNLPDAMEQLDGTVARFEIFPGEPIRETKLVRSDQGYLSAVLTKGMRGVSLEVNAESSAGGFIMPNDRVDVVHAKAVNDGMQSTTILQNVKVLAIGLRLGEIGASGGGDSEDPQANVFENTTIATLELSPNQAEAVIAAEQDGELSLVLRSVSDFSEKVEDVFGGKGEIVRMIRFGVETEILPSGKPGIGANVTALSPALYPSQTQPVFNQQAQEQ